MASKNKQAPKVSPANDHDDEIGPIHVFNASAELNDSDLGNEEGNNSYKLDEVDTDPLVTEASQSRKWWQKLLLPLSLLATITAISWYLWSSILPPTLFSIAPKNNTSGTEATLTINLSQVPNGKRQQLIKLEQEITLLREKRKKLLQQEARLKREVEYLQKQIESTNSRNNYDI